MSKLRDYADRARVLGEQHARIGEERFNSARDGHRDLRRIWELPDVESDPMLALKLGGSVFRGSGSALYHATAALVYNTLGSVLK